MARGYVMLRGRTWYAYWRDPSGKKVGKAVSKRKKDADAFLSKTMADVATGEYVEIEDIAFGEFAARWLSEYLAVHAKKSSYATYKSQLDRHFNPRFEKRKLSSIKPADVQRLLADMKESGLSASSIQMYFVTLKGIFKQAIALRYLKSNPCDPVRPPKKVHHEMRALSPDEVGTFLAACPPEHVPLFTTLVMTGMRIGEACALEWRDVDFSASTIRISKSDYRGLIQTPKSLRGYRTVGVSPALRGVLKSHKAASDASKRVFLMDGEPILQHRLRPVFLRAVIASGLPSFRLHDLRHTYASLMLNARANMKYIQTQLGHASITTTVDRYGHLLPDAHLDAGRRLDGTLFPAKGSKGVR
jgi:integrase